MRDIEKIEGDDFNLVDTVIFKAKNLFETQEDSLTLTSFGIDKDYLFNEAFVLQTQTFNSYLTQMLSDWDINAQEIEETMDEFTQNTKWTVV